MTATLQWVYSVEINTTKLNMDNPLFSPASYRHDTLLFLEEKEILRCKYVKLKHLQKLGVIILGGWAVDSSV
jgi:hypothetical protein